MKWLLVMILVLYLMVVGLVTWVGIQSIRQSNDQNRDTAALCGLHDEIAKREVADKAALVRSRKLVANHPGGVTLGQIRFTPAMIRQSLQQQQDTINNEDVTRIGLAKHLSC